MGFVCLSTPGSTGIILSSEVGGERGIQLETSVSKETKQLSQHTNEQTFSLQLSDSVYSRAFWVWQVVHRTSARNELPIPPVP